jgi:site-specific DNA-methyltransferase (adenine-specific)
MFSSNSVEWETPIELFNELDKEFIFTLDPCSTKDNHKCMDYFTKEDDGLNKDWNYNNVFMNPPYGRNVIDKWIKKAYEESLKDNCVVVALLPVRTDTKWFHDYIIDKAEIRFLKGRLKFSNSKDCAPFPSMIVIW